MAGPVAQGRAPLARLQRLTAWAGRSAASLVLATVLAPTSGWAGAWLPAPGTTQTILTFATTRDSDGHQGTAAELYGERGIDAHWALVLEPAMQDIGATPVGQERLTAFRRLIGKSGGWVASAQAGLIDGPRPDATRAGRPRTFTGAEARLLVGRGFDNGVWLDLEAGRRSCGAATATRWEAALGRADANGHRDIVKAFGEDSACGRARSRVQVSHVHALTPTIGIEFGWRATLRSPDAWGEQGLVIGLWRRY